MPNCFQLLERSTDNELVPVAFSHIDNRMRIHFDAPPDPINWYKHWYDLIGFGLALGRSWADLREAFPDHVDIVNWLETNYTCDAWAER